MIYFVNIHSINLLVNILSCDILSHARQFVFPDTLVFWKKELVFGQWVSIFFVGDKTNDDNVKVFTYLTYHIVSLQFTIPLWGEIGLQHVKAILATTIRSIF